MKLEHILTPYTKINSKWIKGLNVRQETIKLLKENMGKTLRHKSQQDPLWPHPRILETKAKINKWDLMKQKLLHSKGNYKQGEKTASLTSGAGKIGQPLVKEWKTRTLSNTIHKNKFKLD